MFVRLVLAHHVGRGSRPLSMLSLLGWWFVGCPVGGRLIPLLAAVEIAPPVPCNWCAGTGCVGAGG